jgi:hypothetical protein
MCRRVTRAHSVTKAQEHGQNNQVQWSSPQNCRAYRECSQLVAGQVDHHSDQSACLPFLHALIVSQEAVSKALASCTRLLYIAVQHPLTGIQPGAIRARRNASQDATVEKQIAVPPAQVMSSAKMLKFRQGKASRHTYLRWVFARSILLASIVPQVK